MRSIIRKKNITLIEMFRLMAQFPVSVASAVWLFQTHPTYAHSTKISVHILHTGLANHTVLMHATFTDTMTHEYADKNVMEEDATSFKDYLSIRLFLYV